MAEWKPENDKSNKKSSPNKFSSAAQPMKDYEDSIGESSSMSNTNFVRGG